MQRLVPESPEEKIHTSAGVTKEAVSLWSCQGQQEKKQTPKAPPEAKEALQNLPAISQTMSPSKFLSALIVLILYSLKWTLSVEKRWSTLERVLALPTPSSPTASQCSQKALPSRLVTVPSTVIFSHHYWFQYGLNNLKMTEPPFLLLFSSQTCSQNLMLVLLFLRWNKFHVPIV